VAHVNLIMNPGSPSRSAANTTPKSLGLLIQPPVWTTDIIGSANCGWLSYRFLLYTARWSSDGAGRGFLYLNSSIAHGRAIDSNGSVDSLGQGAQSYCARTHWTKPERVESAS